MSTWDGLAEASNSFCSTEGPACSVAASSGADESRTTDYVGRWDRNRVTEALEGKLQGPACRQRSPQIGKSLGMNISMCIYLGVYFQPAHQYVFDQRLRPQAQGAVRWLVAPGWLQAYDQFKVVFSGLARRSHILDKLFQISPKIQQGGERMRTLVANGIGEMIASESVPPG